MAICIRFKMVLKASYKACPECGTSREPTKCEHRNLRRKWDYTFCPYCTKQVKQPENTVEEPSRNEEREARHFAFYEESLADLVKAIELDPRSALAYYNIGFAHSDMKSYAPKYMEWAIDAFTKAIELDPEYSDAYYERAELYFNFGGNWDNESLADFTKAIELDPKYANAYNYLHRAIIRHRNGSYEAAIADFTRAIELDPKYANAYTDYIKSYTHSTLGHGEEQLAFYTKAIEIDPEDKWAYQSRGVVHSKMGNAEEAAQDFENSRRLENGEDPK